MVRQVSLESTVGYHRIELEEKQEGVYIFIYERPSSFPEQDHLADDWEIARQICFEDYGAPPSSWKDVDQTS